MALDTAKFALKLIDGISGPAKKGARSLDKLEKELNQVDRAFKRYGRMQMQAVRQQQRAAKIAKGGTFGSMLGANVASSAVNMLARGATAAAQGAVAGVGALFGRAADTQQHIFALKQMGAGGEKTFNKLRRMSGDYGISLDTAAEGYRKMLASGFTGARAERFLTLGADMKALGTTAEQTKGIFRAMSQMQGLGKISMEELNQLTDAGVGRALIIENVSKRLNKSLEETNNLIAQGKVSAEIGLRATEDTIRTMTGTTSGNVGDAAKDAAMATIHGMVGVAKARGMLFWDSMGQRALPGLMKGARSALDGFGEFFETDRGKLLLEQMGNAAETLGNAIETIGVWAPKAFEAFLGGFDQSRDAFGVATEGGRSFKQMLDDALPAITALGNGVGMVTNMVEGLIAAFDRVSGFEIGGVNVLSALGTAADYSNPIGLTKRMFGAATTLAPNDSGGVVTGMSNGVATVRAAPGEGLASIGVGERIVPANGGGGSSVSIGDISIMVDSQNANPEAVAAETLAAFESKLTTIFNGAMA